MYKGLHIRELQKWGCPMRGHKREDKDHPCQCAQFSIASAVTQAHPMNSCRQGKVMSQIWGPPTRQKYSSCKSGVHSRVRATLLLSSLSSLFTLLINIQRDSGGVLSLAASISSSGSAYPQGTGSYEPCAVRTNTPCAA